MIGLALSIEHHVAPHSGPVARSRAVLSHLLTATGDGERIVPTAIIERVCMGADGQLEPVTAGSTRPVALTTTHAGIVKVKRYSFDLP